MRVALLSSRLHNIAKLVSLQQYVHYTNRVLFPFAGQQAALPVGNMPSSLSACVAGTSGSIAAGYGQRGMCGDAGASFRLVPGAGNSINMSLQLLQVTTYG